MAPPAQLWTGESAALAQRVHARILIDERGTLIELLPAHQPLTLQPYPATDPPLRDARGRILPLWGVSNPDDQGAVAVLTPAAGERRHAIHLLHPERPARLLLEGDGEALWDHPVSNMALSADGRYLAMVRQPDPKVRFRPLSVGVLTVLDLHAQPSGPAVPVTLPPDCVGLQWAMGQRPAWLRGSPCLLYSVMRQVEPGTERRAETEIRMVDLSTGVDQFLTSGHSPVASNDARSILLTRGDAFGLFQVRIPARPGQLLSGQPIPERPIPRRHGLGLPVALIDSRYLIYTGVPHPDAPAGFTTSNSPLVGPKPMQALKVLDLRTGEVLTLLEGIDPRRRITAAWKP